MTLTVCTMPQCQTTAGCVCNSPVAAKVRTILGDTEARLHDAAAENARLQARVEELEAELEQQHNALTNELGRVEHLQDRNAALVKAAQPFADFAQGLHPSMADDLPLTMGSAMARKQVTAGDFRRLRAALEGDT